MQQLETNPYSAILYPSSDGEPVAETSVHLWALVTTIVVLRLYIKSLAQEKGLPLEREGIVLANQYLYYEAGETEKRVAPDVMVIPNVMVGERDHYKIWEEGQVPSVIFEMTSKSTQKQDQTDKKDLYEKLGVHEYWLFDPKGEWITERLKGYRLSAGRYIAITDSRSEQLHLRLVIEGNVIGFYREDTGAKLLAAAELLEALLIAEYQKAEAEHEARQQAQRADQAEQDVQQQTQRAQQAEQRVERMRARLLALGLNPDE